MPLHETNFEKYIGENLFGKIGILIFIIGIGFFVKYAIDQTGSMRLARTLMGLCGRRRYVSTG